MNRIVIALSALGLAACGGAGAKISGSDGAAQGLYAMSTVTKASSDRSSAGIDLAADLSHACPFGGTAKLSGFQSVIDQTGGAKIKQSFTTTYVACGLVKGEGGVAFYDGAVAVVQSVIVDAATKSVSVDQAFKGKVNISGAFDDYLDTDVTQRIEVSKLTANTTGSVNMTLKGSITTSGGTHAFDKEVAITAGSIKAEVRSK
jgi:hypothetical protein